MNQTTEVPVQSAASMLLQVRRLVKYFPVRSGWFRGLQHVRAVDGVSFELYRGRTLGLVGESGCGKSTLGRAILNLHSPTAGDVLLDGLPLAGLTRQASFSRRRDMQIIFQDPFASLSPRRTVAQIVREPLDVHRIGTVSERRQRVEELLEVVGMRSNTLNRYPHEFSGGQRQRIGIARALALKPRFIVADEPVSALDVSVQSQVLNLIQQLQAELGIAFLFISHDLAVIRHISDEIAVMYLGKFVEYAPADKIFSAPKHPYTKALLSSIPAPDPTSKSPRLILEGDVPSPMNPPAGCPFHPRCPVAIDRCSTEAPKLKATQSGAKHAVACHLAT
jgi:peptide/nickel transport system ATP-binding protein/oligopeptide transport system ATP-binding protein